jgi:type I restriction enzyme R subunit
MNHPDHTALTAQKRITELFVVNLGYTYLGNWEELDNNSNIEERHLSYYLSRQGYQTSQINKAILELKQTANSFNDDLYQKNKKIYALLRDGIRIKDGGDGKETLVKVIDWNNWANNDFGVAEEINIKGSKHKRPDIVLYVNGIALGILELKKGQQDITEGVRQMISMQQGHFTGSYFSTIQLVMAGNDTQGLRYGAVKTEEKLYSKWKEAAHDASTFQIDHSLLSICQKERFLELIYDGVIFDAGKKKLPLAQQYFALKAAQENIKNNQGGIIWHTPATGKNNMMLLLAKWILEHNTRARVIFFTDNGELVQQIEDVFSDLGEQVKTSNSGKKFLQQLRQNSPRILCSLVHKLGKKSDEQLEDIIHELEVDPVETDKKLFVFVDECHRMQSGKLYFNLKTSLPNPLFIGFTGTAPIKKDKKVISEIFGSYIHTYNLNGDPKDELLKISTFA